MDEKKKKNRKKNSKTEGKTHDIQCNIARI